MTAYTSAPALGYFQATASIFAKNVAKERIGFSLSSRPRSFSPTRLSCKSLPNPSFSQSPFKTHLRPGRQKWHSY